MYIEYREDSLLTGVEHTCSRINLYSLLSFQILLPNISVPTGTLFSGKSGSTGSLLYIEVVYQTGKCPKELDSRIRICTCVYKH